MTDVNKSATDNDIMKTSLPDLAFFFPRNGKMRTIDS